MAGDTSIAGRDSEGDRQFSAGDKFDLEPRSLVLLFRERRREVSEAAQGMNRRAEEVIVDSSLAPSRGQAAPIPAVDGFA
jgi:hypothetical protein